MVDLFNFIATNFNYFYALGFTLVIILVSYLLYQKTSNSGFLYILIGFSISAVWTGFELFILQGAYFVPGLYETDMLHVDIVVITMILGFVNFIIATIQMLTLAIGLFTIANGLSERYYNPN